MSNCSDSERQDQNLTKRGGETVDEQAPSVNNTMHSEQPCIKRVHRWVLKFTPDEDRFLKQGIKRHGIGQWNAILRDSDFKFHYGRMADPLKKREELKQFFKLC